MTTAIYARYSSDLQSERSIEDQIALCRAMATRDGLLVSACYEDRAISGASMAQRPGLQHLVRDAGEGRFTTLVVESLDRLSRDQADMATLYKRLSFHGVTIIEVHGGTATPINAAVRGLMGTLFLADLAHKVHRGQSGNIRAGKSAGGRAYGYAPVPGQPGARVIVPEEAEVVRRIYGLYAEGQSARAIAAVLNAEGVRPIFGARWNASTLQGRKDRGNGILGNEIYRGELVWNKVRMLKHPDTGKRISRPNPPSQWQRHSLPELAIIDAALWSRVDARRSLQDPRGNMARPQKHMLSGLLKCHCCGGSLVVRDRKNGVTRIRCSTFQESGSCSNNRVYQLGRIERAVLDVLRQGLEHPAAIEAYVREYNAERRRLAAAEGHARGDIERRLTATTAEIERIVNLMVKGIVDPARHAGRLKQLEEEERGLKQRLDAVPATNVVTLHPAAITRYRQHLEQLHQSFAHQDPDGPSLRGLVKRIVVNPDYTFNIEGHLAALTNTPAYPQLGGGLVVAGAGVGQPPTFWLAGVA